MVAQRWSEERAEPWVFVSRFGRTRVAGDGRIHMCSVAPFAGSTYGHLVVPGFRLDSTLGFRPLPLRGTPQQSPIVEQLRYL